MMGGMRVKTWHRRMEQWNEGRSTHCCLGRLGGSDVRMFGLVSRATHLQPLLTVLSSVLSQSLTLAAVLPLLLLTLSHRLLMQQPIPDLSTLYRWLQRTLKQHKLATFTNQLLRDALTVALGVKQAALLDFHLPTPVLELVLQRIHANNTQLFAPLVLLTVTSSADNAVFVLHRPSFLSPSQLQPPSVPLVDISPSLPSPQLLTCTTAAQMTDQLHAFTSSLSTVLEADAAVSHLVLQAPPSVCLPTLCGWLLAYPVLYTFPSSTAVPSSNALSDQPLTLFAVSLHPTTLLSGLSPSFASEAGRVLLQSFSVPTGLLSESGVVLAMQVWERRMGEVCGREPVKRWVDQLSISKTALCLPHVSL